MESETIAAIKAKCERDTGWKCTLGCTTACHKTELDKKIAKSRRGRRDNAKQAADRIAAKVQNFGADMKAKAREASAQDVARRGADKIRNNGTKGHVDKHGYDGQPPTIRTMKLGQFDQHQINTSSRKVAELRRRDDSWSVDMEMAAVKFEHDWRLVNEAAVRGQAIKEYVDGAGHGVDPNAPVIRAHERLKAAQNAIGDMAFNLIVSVFVKGDSVDSVARLLKSQHRAVAEMTKEALNSLAIHYGYARSHLSQRRLAALEESIRQWLKSTK